VTAKTVAALLLVIAGALLSAFFVTFNALFSDGPRDTLHVERLATYAMSLAAHGLVAAVGARFGGGRWPSWAVAAAAPSVAVALVYATHEPGVVELTGVYAFLALLGAVLGARLARPAPPAVTAS
jgi:hypothetical protein